MKLRHLLAIPVLLAAQAAHAQDRTADLLAPLAQCINRSEFQFKTQDRLPASATTRVVKMAAGERRVSTADGYRLMLFRKSSLPLANLKIERSAAGQFAADRETIVAQMQEMSASSKPPHQVPLETDARQGVEVLGLNNASIAKTPGIISFYTLLHAASGTVASAYVLNQPADPRDFATDAQYQALRDQFIASLANCMADPAQ
ncbi:hypothetical protein JAB5_09630 [Janthinobacterium sp. HH103]|uniref:hypothetical protein n=1 Tax=unclassified Janthinobacterium TaxID=2610881 RepID=UPI0008735065|nr:MULTISPECIES: hypothetical protein [unclassified Janthinobacterium]OEZ72943.1 hypothetical protein JAB2_05460 [Janthinobacterium sp. HH100]OEZ85915.1 hypothetical protein JAB5_09630 [Janthinobacterium sp. HH103]QOU73662.1 hypothetical protein JAB4_031210 [Janthinobacterium sp. HH102]